MQITSDEKAVLAFAQARVVMAKNLVKTIILKREQPSLERERFSTLLADIASIEETIEELAKSK
jgi:hypothetical protein